MNKIILQGRLTRDVEVLKSQKGGEIAKFTLAVSRKANKEQTDFINCVAFGNLVKPLAEYTQKGNRLLVEGSLQIDTYLDKDGNTKSSVSVIISDFYFLDYKKVDNTQTQIPM